MDQASFADTRFDTEKVLGARKERPAEIGRGDSGGHWSPRSRRDRPRARGAERACSPRRPRRAALETHPAASLMFRGDRAPTTLAQARAVSTLLNLEFAAGDHAGAAGRHSGGLCDASRKPSPFSTDTPCPQPPGLWRELTPRPSPGATLSSGPGFSPGTAGRGAWPTRRYRGSSPWPARAPEDHSSPLSQSCCPPSRSCHRQGHPQRACCPPVCL